MWAGPLAPWVGFCALKAASVSVVNVRGIGMIAGRHGETIRRSRRAGLPSVRG